MVELKNTAMYSFEAVVRGLLLIGFAFMTLKLYLTGDILHFISPRMIWFTKFFILTAFTLGILSIMWRKQDNRYSCSVCACSHQHPQTHPWLYSFFLIPIASGFLFPNHVLTNEIAQNRMFSTNGSKSIDDIKSETKAGEEGTAPTLPSGYEKELARQMEQEEMISVVDKYYVPVVHLLMENPESYEGKEIHIKGFVYFDEQLNRYIIGRYGISCCIADATVYGLPVGFSKKPDIKEGEWVYLTGKLTTIDQDGERLPNISVTNTQKISTPKSPYVYEIIEDLTPK